MELLSLVRISGESKPAAEERVIRGSTSFMCLCFYQHLTALQGRRCRRRQNKAEKVCINGFGIKETQQHCAAAPPAGRMPTLVAKQNPNKRNPSRKLSGRLCPPASTGRIWWRTPCTGVPPGTWHQKHITLNWGAGCRHLAKQVF